jgi:hypothetical protein
MQDDIVFRDAGYPEPEPKPVKYLYFRYCS